MGSTASSSSSSSIPPPLPLPPPVPRPAADPPLPVVAVGVVPPSTTLVVHELNQKKDYYDDDRTPAEWAVSFAAMMVPFVGFLYGHSRGMTVRAMEYIVHSRVGVPGLLLLPFMTLAMEKSIYDTIQSAQGFDPKIVPADRGGFPSGGGAALPSFSFIPVQERHGRGRQRPGPTTSTVPTEVGDFK
jgi:hypothetical protein